MTRRTHAVRAVPPADTTPVDGLVPGAEPEQVPVAGQAAARPRAASVARGRRANGVANPFRRTVD